MDFCIRLICSISVPERRTAMGWNNNLHIHHTNGPKVFEVSCASG